MSMNCPLPMCLGAGQGGWCLKAVKPGHHAMGLFSKKISLMLCGVWAGTRPQWRLQVSSQGPVISEEVVSCSLVGTWSLHSGPRNSPALLLGVPAVSAPSRESCL